MAIVTKIPAVLASENKLHGCLVVATIIPSGEDVGGRCDRICTVSKSSALSWVGEIQGCPQSHDHDHTVHWSWGYLLWIGPWGAVASALHAAVCKIAAISYEDHSFFHSEP